MSLVTLGVLLSEFRSGFDVANMRTQPPTVDQLYYGQRRCREERHVVVDAWWWIGTILRELFETCLDAD